MPIIINAGPTRPSAPTLTGVVPADAAAVASWDAPSSNGRSAILRYELVIVLASDSSPFRTDTVSGSVTSATITGLTNDTTYSVRVRAVNGVGSSALSGSLDVTPAGDQGGVTGGTGDEDDTPPPFVPAPQPALEAFPTRRAFVPANWLLSREEAVQ